MSRPLRALILLTVLLWQSVAAFGSVAVTHGADELAHRVMHAQDLHHHHHHADRTLHMDDAAVEINHLHADSANSSLALLQSLQTSVVSMRAMSAPASVSIRWRSATLAGLLRPPATSA
jgi:hypothetical protein